MTAMGGRSSISFEPPTMRFAVVMFVFIAGNAVRQYGPDRTFVSPDSK
jgi:hypothetical protein